VDETGEGEAVGEVQRDADEVDQQPGEPELDHAAGLRVHGDDGADEDVGVRPRVPGQGRVEREQPADEEGAGGRGAHQGRALTAGGEADGDRSVLGLLPAAVPLGEAPGGDEHDDDLLAGAAGEVGGREGGEEDEAGEELGGPGPQGAAPAEREGQQADHVADHVGPLDVLAEDGERLGVQPVHRPSPLPRARSPIMRSTYLAMTSTSRLTGSPGCLRPSVVRSRVVGMRLTVKKSGPASTTVRLMPSTVMEPFSTT